MQLDQAKEAAQNSAQDGETDKEMPESLEKGITGFLIKRSTY